MGYAPDFIVPTIGSVSILDRTGTLAYCLPIREDGKLGPLIPGDYDIELTQSIDVDNVFAPKAGFQVEYIPHNGNCFKKTVRVFRDESGTIRTRYPDNTMIVTRSNCRDRGEIFAISLIAQNNDVFLVAEAIGGYRFYNASGRMTCPALKNWSGLKRALTNGIKITDLTPLGDHCSAGRMAQKALEERQKREQVKRPTEADQAVVSEWSSSKGNGVILTKDQTIRVTWRACPERSAGGRRYLRVGERVIVKRVEEIKNGNSISFRALEVVFPKQQ